MPDGKRKKKTQPKLAEYRRKRDFTRTPEPQGDAAGSSGSNPIFVVQKHAARQLHYDFRLEFEGILRSWAVPKGPSLDPTQKPLAVRTEDHPMEYASFEGIIPKGEYGGGTVMLWDTGEFSPIGDAEEGYERGDLKFQLYGEKLRGAWVLVRMKGDESEGGKNWLLIKKNDAEARRVEVFNVVAEQPRSVVSGRSLKEITEHPDAVWKDGRSQKLDTSVGGRRAKKPRSAVRSRKRADVSKLTGARKSTLPSKLRPQLTTSVDHAPDGEEWLHEIKLDGFRMICRIADDGVRLFTRNGNDWTDRLARIAQAAERLPIDAAVLDGEIVVLDDRGISDFQALQNVFRAGERANVVYFVFDVPYAAGYDLRQVPLLERKAFLEHILKSSPKSEIQFCDHIVGNGPRVYAEAAKAGLEGIIAKRVRSPYESRRTHSWLKVKCTQHETFVIGGFTRPSGSRTGFGALLLGHYDRTGRLTYCGRVGTGFDERTLTFLHEELTARRVDTPPFWNSELDAEPRAVLWVRPDLVAAVEFVAWTNDGLVRHAVFRGLREDIDPKSVVRAAHTKSPARDAVRSSTPMSGVVEIAASPDHAHVAGVRISHPDRTIYPEEGVTKREVAEYYLQIADWILPYLVKRPLSLVRCPLGLAGEAFYQRQLGEGFPKAIRQMQIGDDTGILIDNLDGLLSLVQMGVLEIHAWGCRSDKPERPDQLTSDLDPGEGILWEHVVASATFIRDYLLDLGLEIFVKTSGGHGLHLVVPLVRRADWSEAKVFAKAVADDIVRIAPRNFVATASKRQRAGKIYVDYLRNQLSATAVAAYSTRARDGATISTPLRWDELSAELEPHVFTVQSVPERLGQCDDNPWAGFLKIRQSITADMKRALRMET